jgi:serine/threonine protein kinase
LPNKPVAILKEFGKFSIWGRFCGFFMEAGFTDMGRMHRMLQSSFEQNGTDTVLEMCLGAELDKPVFREERDLHPYSQLATILAREAFEALFFLHDHCYAHNDVKPANFGVVGDAVDISWTLSRYQNPKNPVSPTLWISKLRDTGDLPQLKLLDFGFTRKYEDQGKMFETNWRGTEPYMSYECYGLMQGDTSIGGYDTRKNDLFAMARSVLDFAVFLLVNARVVEGCDNNASLQNEKSFGSLLVHKGLLQMLCRCKRKRNSGKEEEDKKEEDKQGEEKKQDEGENDKGQDSQDNQCSKYEEINLTPLLTKDLFDVLERCLQKGNDVHYDAIRRHRFFRQ